MFNLTGWAAQPSDDAVNMHYIEEILYFWTLKYFASALQKFDPISLTDPLFL
jgi:hypothetical protein